ncbi:response regulator transcription factor [Neglectibacter caecimuris]|uniref:response regulator transcription factor n=1 Tax=Neglectibacter caecimuris TaxID=3093658 RepID=UPI002AC98F85|nr:response regulator transcription factor [Neglectibacter sp. M00184]
MYHILVVEDDQEINRLLCRLLEQNNYCPIPALNGLEALQTLEQETVDLILLDLMLPGLHGEQLLAEIRRAGTVPVIIVSAKTNMEGKVELLRQGADDYITKPFHTGEVLARIQACLRRALRDNAPPAVLHTHGLTLDTCAKAASVEGHTVPLTAKEYKLLETLALNPHMTFSKRQLFEAAWHEPYLNGNALNTHISNLRKKLKAKGADCIETIFGIGYKLREEEHHGNGI